MHKRGILQQYGATLDMLLSDIQDHYRTYTMIERYLKIPHRLDTQLAFQIAPDTQLMMIERFVLHIYFCANTHILKNTCTERIYNDLRLFAFLFVAHCNKWSFMF